jgi:hypothetical protein
VLAALRERRTARTVTSPRRSRRLRERAAPRRADAAAPPVEADVSRRSGSDPDARLYLVVLDGCSYPVFLELLLRARPGQRLPDRRAPRRRRTRGRAPGAGAPADGHQPRPRRDLPGRAAERSAGGRDRVSRPGRGEDRQGALQSERRPRRRTRKLFLKGDLADGGQALLAALETSFAQSWPRCSTPSTIRSARRTPARPCASRRRTSPRSSRACAARSRRPHVLITADHGHSPYMSTRACARARQDAALPAARQERRRTPRASSRSTSRARRPARAPRLRLAERRLPRRPQVGFHGGCSLEEMVVPLAWLERDGLHADEPSWWYGAARSGGGPPPVRRCPPIVTPLPSTSCRCRSRSSRCSTRRQAPTRCRCPAGAAGAAQQRREVGAGAAARERLRPRERAGRALKKNPGALNGLMVHAARTLHAEGELFTTRRCRAVRRCTATKARRGADGRRP